MIIYNKYNATKCSMGCYICLFKDDYETTQYCRNMKISLMKQKNRLTFFKSTKSPSPCSFNYSIDNRSYEIRLTIVLNRLHL